MPPIISSGTEKENSPPVWNSGKMLRKVSVGSTSASRAFIVFHTIWRWLISAALGTPVVPPVNSRQAVVVLGDRLLGDGSRWGGGPVRGRLVQGHQRGIRRTQVLGDGRDRDRLRRTTMHSGVESLRPGPPPREDGGAS